MQPNDTFEKLTFFDVTNLLVGAIVGADIYVQPSKSEGCSFTVAEAMLLGRPVVVTPCGGLPEQVVDGRTGVVAGGTGPEELAAAISVFVNDKKLAARLGEAGRQVAQEKFSTDVWLERTIRAFQDAAAVHLQDRPA